MKISCDVECTPEEARRFMGLPDLTPVHEAYIAKMTEVADKGMTPEALTGMMQSWGPMSEAGLGLWKTMVDGMTSLPKAK